MKTILLLSIVSVVFPLTEDGLVRHALRNSHQAKKYFITIRESEAERDKAAKAARPGVSASVNANYGKDLDESTYLYADTLSGVTVTPGVTATQPVPGGGSASASFSATSGDIDRKVIEAEITQPLLRGAWAGDRPGYTKKSGEILFQIAKKENLYLVMSHVSDLRLAFWRTYVRQEIIRILEYADTIAAITHGHAKKRLELGDVSPLDTLESLMQLNNVRIDLLKAKVGYNDERRDLSNLANLDTVEALEAAEIDYRNQIEVEQQIEKALESNLDFIKETDLASYYALDERYRKNLRLPRLDLYAGYYAAGKGDYYRNGYYQAGVTLSYDFFNNTSDDEFRMAKWARKKQELTVKEKRRALALEIKGLGDNLRLNLANIKTIQKNVEMAEIKERLSESLYTQGDIDIIAKMKAQNDLIQSRLSLLEAEAAIMALFIRLDLLTGGLLPKYNISYSTETK